jgi:hypothetical protein
MWSHLQTAGHVTLLNKFDLNKAAWRFFLCKCHAIIVFYFFLKYLSNFSFQLALPHMRQIVQKTFGRPITIELLEKLQLPPSNSNSNATNIIQASNSNVIINQQQQQQQHSTPFIQQPLYTTVQPQQKINILQQTPHPALIGSTASLLSQQQHQQQQARTQIVCEIVFLLN